MLLSAGFHTFCCHSEMVYRKWLALDLAGISMSLVGMYISSLYYGFYCYWVSLFTLIYVNQCCMHLVFNTILYVLKLLDI